MTKRKVLPYHASQLVDLALMENQDAIRALLPMVSGKELTVEDTMRRLAKAIHHIHESSRALRGVRRNERESSAYGGSGAQGVSPPDKQ